MIHYINSIAMCIGYFLLAGLSVWLLYFLSTLPRIFPRACDRLNPDKGLHYTKYVFNTVPWLPSRVWRHIIGPFYFRIPESFAERDTAQRLMERFIEKVARNENLTIQQWREKHKGEKPRFMIAAEQEAKRRGCTAKQVLDDDLDGVRRSVLFEISEREV